MNIISRMMIVPAQIKAARALLGVTQARLAEMSGLSKTALINIEAGSSDPKASTLDRIQKSLEMLGAVFIPENGDGPGVRLRKAAP
jgi:transcriptional regulator with XRE-family HTH domain